MSKYLAFDLEIATPIPPGTDDWSQYRPFGIACAATWASDMSVPLLWNNIDGDKGAGLGWESVRLLNYLEWAVDNGYTIVTFNGAGFDFDVLAEETGKKQSCIELARNHVDIFFQIFCVKGYAKGLDTIARGMGLQGKPKGVNGAAAPQMWRDGRYHEVLEYCAQDAKMTLDLVLLGEKRQTIEWWTKKGDGGNGITLPDGWLTVEQATQLPQPDTSWMKNPWTREKFVGWME